MVYPFGSGLRFGAAPILASGEPKMCGAAEFGKSPVARAASPKRALDVNALPPPEALKHHSACRQGGAGVATSQT
jgi:hypothetical protein